MGTVAADIARQSGRKVLWTAITFTSSAAVYTLPATLAEDGSPAPLGKNAPIILQPTVDVNYRPCKAAAVAGASNTNSCKVLADQQEQTSLKVADVAMDVTGVAAGGTLKVFLLLPGIG